jgi:hypothetical protein
MGDRLDIGHLRTRIRGVDAARTQQLASQVQALGGRELPRALEGCSASALARAGLPATAVVAVKWLALHLRVSDGVQPMALAAGWAAALEDGLVRQLTGLAPGDDDEQAPAVWFADAWAAERRHLERRARGAPDAWWTASLLMDDDADDPDDPLAILQRWLRHSPGRAVVEMAALVRAEPRSAQLLEPAQATRLAHTLLAALADNAPGGAARQGRERPAIASDAGAPTAWPAPQHHELRRLRAALLAHRDRLRTFAMAASCEPWLAALLLAAHPSASRLGASILLALVRDTQASSAAGTDRPAAASAAPGMAEPPPSARAAGASAGAPTDATANPPTADVTPRSEHRVHAGGLLLLLRPLARLALLEGCAAPGRALGDVALLALQRVFAPLKPGARMAALERERPLLAVFAPECDWSTRITDAPISDPQTAAGLLERLAAAIPAGIAFAPGASREIFGMQSAAYPIATEHRLAALLLRPGLLRVIAWEAEIEWPLAAIDLALRRTGWDQDPGWVPWIGRTIRLRFGAGR